MRRVAALFPAVLLLAACGTPTSPTKQAEELGSIAAEGALVAHDASEGSTTDTFTRVHGRALRDLADKIDEHAARPVLRELAGRISGALDELAAHPGDERRAGQIQRSLERAARDANDLEKSA